MKISIVLEVNGNVAARYELVNEKVLTMPDVLAEIGKNWYRHLIETLVAAETMGPPGFPDAPAPQPGVLAPEIVNVGGKLRLREVTLPVDP